jgi:ubiquinone/menaquinone biosynthesis C-methylase UbiE
MAHVCPWWGGFFLGSFLRRMVHNPDRILGSLVKPGQTGADIGCGPGLFAVAMAGMVGPSGRVMAVDLQPEMLEQVRRRAVRAGVAERVTLHTCRENTLDLPPATSLDFVLAMMMVHEVPDRERLLREIAAAIRPGGALLICEPKFHVRAANFVETVRLAEAAGLVASEGPRVFMCRSVVMRKGK